MRLYANLILTTLLVFATPSMLIPIASTLHAAPSKKKKKKTTKKPSAAKLFSKGKKFFDQGKYNDALGVFSDLLRAYPAHSAAQLMMAKSFYRLERQNEAYALFSRQNPQYLDPESSYEYGMTMFKARQFPQSLYAFRKMPKNHSLYDLSNYYGALSAVKLRKFKLAEDLMEKAVVLPDKLARSRTEYLKHLTELRVLREKQALAKQRKVERDRIKQKKNGKKSAASAKKEPEAPKEYAHSGKKSIGKGAVVAVKNKSQRYDLHGFGIKDFNIRIGAFGFEQGPMWTFGKSMKRRTAAGLQLEVVAADVEITGDEQRNFVFDDSQDILRIQRDSTDSHTKEGSFALRPWIEFPVPNDVWVAFGADFDFTYYEFERSQREGTRDVYLQVAGPLAGSSASAVTKYIEYINSDNEPQSNTVSLELSSSFTKFKDVGFAMTATVENFDYLDNAIDGPDTSVVLNFSATKPFLEILSASLSGTFDNQLNHVVHGLGSYPQIDTDVQIFGGKIGLSSSPWSWLALGASYEIQQFKWSVVDEDDPQGRQDTIERNKADVLETTEVKAVIILNF